MILDKIRAKVYLHRCKRVAKSYGNDFKVNGKSHITPNTILGNNVHFNGMHIQGATITIGELQFHMTTHSSQKTW